LTDSPGKALLVLGWLAAASAAAPRFDPSWARLPAGTEIPELRSPTSHTYSDGDGVYVAEVSATATAAGNAAVTSSRSQRMTDSVVAVATGYVFAYELHGFWSYIKYGPDMLYYGVWNNSWAKFDLAPIPDSGHILAVDIGWYQYEVFDSGVEVVVKIIGCDPVVTSAEPLWYAIQNGTPGSNSDTCDGIGWKDLALDETGRRHIDSCLVQDWVALGIHQLNSSAGGHGFGTEGGGLAPYLRVQYTRPGTCEPPVESPYRPELMLVPNPTDARVVLVRCALAIGTRLTLTTCDVTGRILHAYPLDASGITQLDLRGFAPGVYMATLEAGSQSLTRKLVITTR
jgi:hypothetical protein